MTRYVALLRGINVGGHRKVPMAQLRELAESIGLDDVSTYIASGNLLFGSTASEGALTKKLHAALHKEFGFAIDVVVVSQKHLAEALTDCPFDGDPKQVVVTFLSETYDAGTREAIEKLATGDERIEFGLPKARWLYVDYAGGLARSKLGNKMHSVGKSGYATTRNLATVRKLVALG